MSEKISAIFFCGDKSRYGAAHISPVLEEFDVKAIVLADDERWQQFRRSLHGRTPPRASFMKRWRQESRGWLKVVIPDAVVRLIRKDDHREQKISHHFAKTEPTNLRRLFSIDGSDRIKDCIPKKDLRDDR